MRQSGFRVWKVLAGLAAAGLSVGCGYLPDTGALKQEGPPETFLGTMKAHLPPDASAQFHYSADRGYNGTIQQLGSSIDPRTPETSGQMGNSIQDAMTGRPVDTELGIGGSGDARELGNRSGSIDDGWRTRRGYELGTGEQGIFIGPPGSGEIPGP
jgi:hypothetical protein